MNPSNEPAVWDDDRLDALLTDFFRREMPAELRTARTSRPAVENARPVRVSSVRSAGNRRAPGGVAVIVISAACLALAVWGTASPPGGPSRLADDRPHGRAADAEPLARTPAAADALVVERVEERLEPVERSMIHTARGPVEQRADLRTTNVSVFDAWTGTTLEVELPELDIQIIPLDDR